MIVAKLLVEMMIGTKLLVEMIVAELVVEIQEEPLMKNMLLLLLITLESKPYYHKLAQIIVFL